MPDYTCPVCEIHFTGRPNKKFCSEKCRSLHNTRLYMERNVALFDQEKIRRKNAIALKTIFKVIGEKEFRRATLERVGFDFRVATFASEEHFSLAFGNYVLHRLDSDSFTITQL